MSKLGQQNAGSRDFSRLVSSESWLDLGNLEPLKPGRPSPLRDRQHCPARPSPIPPTIAPTAEPSAFSPASPPAAQASRPKDAPFFSTSPRRLSPTDQPDFPPSPTASRMYSKRPLSRVPPRRPARCQPEPAMPAPCQTRAPISLTVAFGLPQAPPKHHHLS